MCEFFLIPEYEKGDIVRVFGMLKNSHKNLEDLAMGLFYIKAKIFKKKNLQQAITIQQLAAKSRQTISKIDDAANFLLDQNTKILLLSPEDLKTYYEEIDFTGKKFIKFQCSFVRN